MLLCSCELGKLLLDLIQLVQESLQLLLPHLESDNLKLSGWSCGLFTCAAFSLDRLSLFWITSSTMEDNSVMLDPSVFESMRHDSFCRVLLFQDASPISSS